MDGDISILAATAISVGVLHTLLGPDHYVPFAAMSKCRGWSARKTYLVTSLCGLGHVLGSVVIGCVGLAVGTALFQLESLESFRGDVAAWLLIGFGLAYLVWGVTRAIRDVPHKHVHAHLDGTIHSHLHQHDLDHRHVHDREMIEMETAGGGHSIVRRSFTPWALFVIFVFGPCEVLIPLLMYPAAESNFGAVLLVVAAFGVATIGTMLAAVAITLLSLRALPLPDLHRYGHAMSGAAVLACGSLMKLGL